LKKAGGLPTDASVTMLLPLQAATTSASACRAWPLFRAVFILRQLGPHSRTVSLLPAMPDSGTRLLWDLLLVIFLLYVALIIPARLCLEVDVTPLGPTFWFEMVLDICFLCDILLNFRTAFEDADSGLLITSAREIARRYLRGWFVIDALAVPAPRHDDHDQRTLD
jgi:hypothetical protein